MRTPFLLCGAAFITLAAFACGGGQADPNEPAASATAEASATATADASAQPVTTATATATATASATASAPPAPPPPPESFVKVQGPFETMLGKLADDIAAQNGDCKKIAAKLTAFTADKNNAKAGEAYNAEYEKLSADQKKPVDEKHAQMMKDKVDGPLQKCGSDDKNKKAIGDALTKLMKIISPKAEAPKSDKPADKKPADKPAPATPSAKK